MTIRLAKKNIFSFNKTMQISSHKPINKESFRSGQFVNASAYLEKNIVLNRAIIDMCGCDIPWVVMANNKQERIEKAIRYSIVFAIGFLSPILTLPFSNRIAMRSFSKLTDSFFSNNHKALHLSNEFLTSDKKMMEGLKELSEKTVASPVERLLAWLKIKPVKPQVLDVADLVKKAGSEKQLREILINKKNGVLCSDLIFSCMTLGSVNFINNHLTAKRAGQKGFSAEFNMAEKKIVKKERTTTKKQNGKDMEFSRQ